MTYNPADIGGAEAGHSQQCLLGRSFDRKREVLRIGLRPNKLWVLRKAEISFFGKYHLLIREAIFSKQPVGLVQTMLSGKGSMVCLIDLTEIEQLEL